MRSERKLLDDECMTLLKEIVRLRDGGCVTPGASCGGYLTASHWKKRGKQRVRYDLRNVNCQCANCNGRHNHFTENYDQYMYSHYGDKTFHELTELALLPAWKWSLSELQKIRDDLKSYLKELKEE